MRKFRPSFPPINAADWEDGGLLLGMTLISDGSLTEESLEICRQVLAEHLRKVLGPSVKVNVTKTGIVISDEGAQ